MSKLFKKVILLFNVFIVSTFVLLGCSKMMKYNLWLKVMKTY